jgi:hypothetical protein
VSFCVEGLAAAPRPFAEARFNGSPGRNNQPITPANINGSISNCLARLVETIIDIISRSLNIKFI